MTVIDASVLIEYLTEGEHAAQARAVILAHGDALRAPHLIDAEVGHVLRRAVACGRLHESAASAAVVDLAELPLRRAAHLGLLARAWELRENVSFYDALYLALAERLDEPLITLDARLSRAPGVRAQIIVLG